MPIDALSVLCVQLTRDLLAIAKFLLLHVVRPLQEITLNVPRDILITAVQEYVEKQTSRRELLECRE